MAEELMTYRQIMAKLAEAGHKVYLVGGAVRNAYLNLPVTDYDIVTSATPTEILELFEYSKIINATFSVSTYVPSSEKGGYVEVTTMREESDDDYVDGKPSKFTFTDDITKDLARRDATINAIASDVDGNIIDPHNGRQHLKEKKIIAIGDPRKRIIAHPIRMMRYARFGVSLGSVFTLDPMLINAIIDNRRYLILESWDAIGKEFMKGLATDMSEKYLLTLHDLKLLEIVIPELEATVGMQQNVHHHFQSVWTHILRSMHTADKYELTPVQKVGTMLHDIGKPLVAHYRPDYGNAFHRHEIVGVPFAEAITHRLGLDEEERKRVELAVRYHMYPITNIGSAKRFLGKMNTGGNLDRELIKERAVYVMAVRLTDTKPAPQANQERLERENVALEFLKEAFKQEEAFLVTDLMVNGNDIMETLSIPQGRAVGNVLEELLEQVIDGTIENKKEALLEEAKRIHGIEDPTSLEGVQPQQE